MSLSELGGIDGATYSGFVSEIRSWDHARASSDVALQIDWILSGDEDGLSAYWRLNEGRADAAADLGAAGADRVLDATVTWRSTSPSLRRVCPYGKYMDNPNSLTDDGRCGTCPPGFQPNSPTGATGCSLSGDFSEDGGAQCCFPSCTTLRES